MNRNDLLMKAAHCYLNTGHIDKAIGLLERSGQYHDMAILLQSQNNPEAAGHGFMKAGQYGDALVCFEQSQNHEMQIQCLMAMEKPLAAAWLAAHALEDRLRAQALCESIDTPSHPQSMAIALIQLRLIWEQEIAQTILDTISNEWISLDAPWRRKMEGWIIEISTKMRRMDVACAIFALNLQAGIAGTASRWKRWSMQQGLGLPSLARVEPDAQQHAQWEGSLS